MKFNKIVIWGLRKRYHTHRHIHQAFYKNAKKLGYKVIWVEDEKENAKHIEPNDLIITAEPVGKMIPEKFKMEEYNLPIRSDVFYCLHNCKKIFIDKLEENKCTYMFLQVYLSQYDTEADIRISPVSFFNRKTKTLYQPWGTDLLPQEFKKPIFRKNSLVFWIGSVWNDAAGHGNINEIAELKRVLAKRRLKFIQLRFIPDWLNIFFVRLSRIAPAISGKWQAEENYLPCRVFKNVSYGQVAITNVKRFKNIFGGSFIDGNTIEEIIEKTLSLKKEEYIELVRKQQEIVKNYTYKNSLENIMHAFDLINNNHERTS